MGNGLVNSINDNFKTIMVGYEDGKLLRLKGRAITRKQSFVGAIDSRISLSRLWHV
jgi:hypothetical protein